MQQTNQNLVLIGSHTADKEAQSVFEYNPNKQQAHAVLTTINPTFITVHEGWIYIVSEVEKGEIITLNGKHELVSRVSTLGSSPCHISVNGLGNYLTVCNYSSGSVAMFVLQDHQPTKIRCFITHQGHSINQQRQQSPHPHCSLFTPCNKIMFVTDLGTDVVYYYSISEQQIKPMQEKSIKMPGSGPRTICHGPVDQKRVFVSGQLDNTIRMLSYEKDMLELVAAYRVSNNPENFPSQVSFWNNEVYIALRGDDKIIVFNDEKDKLSQKLAFRVGKWPRHFTITDYGVMYVACQNDAKVVRYLFKDDKILQIGEMGIPNPTVIAVLPNNEQQ